MQPGERIAARYRLDERLGRGGMGEVWRGHDLALGRPVALKVLLNVDADDEALARFRREASIGAQLQHPGVTVVHDIGRHDDQLFIVMELLDGEDLAHALKRTPGGLPVADAVGLAGQAAEALAATHARGVVHRDLKPANLFLLADGRLKVCDFGIARGLQGTQTATRTGWFLGTPPYMAPEQWRGSDVDTRADMYALGCVLYEMLTGATPFPSEGHPLALMHRHFDDEPAPITSVRPGIPTGLAALVAQLLAKEPGARPDAETTVRRLRESAEGNSEGNSDNEVGDAEAVRHKRALSRRGVLVGGATTLVAATAGAAWALTGSGGSGGKGRSSGRALASGTSSQPPVPTTPPSGYITTGSASPVYELSFSPDGSRLAIHAGDVWLADSEGGSADSVPFLTAGGKYLRSLQFAPDTWTLAASYMDRTIWLWNVDDPPGQVVTLQGDEGDGVAETVVFSPDGSTLACSYDDGIGLWDIASRTQAATLIGTSSLGPPTFSPDGALIACGASDPGTRVSIQLWNARTHTNFEALPSGRSDARGPVAFSRDGKLLAVRTMEGGVQFWDLATSTRTEPLAGDTTRVEDIAFSPDGRTMATTGGEMVVRLWDVATRACTAVLKDDTGVGGPVVFSPDGRLLATGATDARVGVWKLF